MPHTAPTADDPRPRPCASGRVPPTTALSCPDPLTARSPTRARPAANLWANISDFGALLVNYGSVTVSLH